MNGKMEFSLKVKKLKEDAKINPPAKDGDAGFDVFATKDVVLEPQERFAMPLGIAIEFPRGYVCIVMDKSGIANNHGLHSIGSVIDNCYRGEVHCILSNISNKKVKIENGRKIAQLIFYKCYTTNNIKYVDELSKTTRGSGKFGSTGV